jgi:NADH dehydrogenase FAD-containing subunit
MIEKKGGTFIKGEVDLIDPVKQKAYLKNNEKVEYDIISFNTGSIINEIDSDNTSNIFPVKPIINLLMLKKKIKELSLEKRLKISVIGAGAAGIEISSAIDSYLKNSLKTDADINLFAGTKILSGFSSKLKKLVLNSMEDKGIKIINNFVEKIENNQVFTADKSFDADIIIMATGTKASDIFKNSGISTGPYNDLLVNNNLQSVDYKNIFGAGDCIYYKNDPLTKVGVYPVRQSRLIFNNLSLSLKDKKLLDFNKGPDYLQILNIGEKNGILKKRNFVFKGKLAFKIKDYIDKKFMKKFKAYE